MIGTSVKFTCTTPFCGTPKEPQVLPSVILRTVAIVLGTLLLLTALFASWGVIGFQNIGNLPYQLLGLGLGVLAAGFFFKCVEVPRIVDPRIYETQVTHSNNLSNESTLSKLLTLKNIIESNGPYTKAIREKFLARAGRFNLEERLLQNYGTTRINLAILATWREGRLDEAQLFGLLDLVFMTNEELLCLPLDKVAEFDPERANILTLRLHHATVNKVYPKHTLGWFRSLKGAPFLKQLRYIPASLYPFFTLAQAASCLQQYREIIDTAYLYSLFPVQALPFMRLEAQKKLALLPRELEIETLPYFDTEYLYEQMCKNANLPYEKATAEQLLEIFPDFDEYAEETRRKMELVPQAILNKILPLLSAKQIQLIPNQH